MRWNGQGVEEADRLCSLEDWQTLWRGGQVVLEEEQSHKTLAFQGAGRLRMGQVEFKLLGCNQMYSLSDELPITQLTRIVRG